MSDRRLTFLDGTVADDAVNKAVIFHDRACFAYTGISQIGSLRTDEWIAQQLIGRAGVQDAITGLKAALDNTIHKLPGSYRKLAVVIDLWGAQHLNEPRTAYSVVLSNYMSPKTRTYVEKPFPEFEQFTQQLPVDKGYAFLPLGQNLDMGIYKEMVRNLVRAMRHASPEPTTILPTTVGRFMQQAILRVASGNRAVGSNLMMTVLFNRDLPENEGAQNFAAYRSASAEDLVLYAPTVITPSVAIKRLKVYPGAPRFKIIQ